MEKIKPDLTLNWTNLTNISEPTHKDTNAPGVYIWGFTINNIFIPYYVGIANNIILRIKQHIKSIIGGEYNIFHRDSLANFKEFKYQDVQTDFSKGKLYQPKWPQGYNIFLKKRKELQPHIDFMIDTFTYSFAVIYGELISKQDLYEIEKICMNRIGKDNLINTKCGESDKFLIKHIGNPIVIEKFTQQTANDKFKEKG